MNIVRTTTSEYRKQLKENPDKFQSIRGNTIRISEEDIEKMLSADQAMVIYETRASNLKEITEEIKNASQLSSTSLKRAHRLLLSLTLYSPDYQMAKESMDDLNAFVTEHKNIELSWGLSVNKKDGHGVGVVLWSFFDLP